MGKVIFWDFDGTLGYRQGNWEGAIFELVEDEKVKTKTNYDLISVLLQNGFPWHKPEKNYLSINNSINWWAFVNPKFIQIFEALGYEKHESVIKATKVAEQYSKLQKWKIYEDVIPNLTLLQNQMWKNILVTNNIPEFPIILKKLDLEKYFDRVFVSSIIGFNKPNPLIIQDYLDKIGSNSKTIVVGDRVESDIAFADFIHAEGILVRSTEKTWKLNFDNLTDLTKYILSLEF
jgi:putative hydrolase of the HAD superfamily